MFIDMDSTICQVHGYAKQGAAYGYTRGTTRNHGVSSSDVDVPAHRDDVQR
jgi:hypothetical protein